MSRPIQPLFAAIIAAICVALLPAMPAGAQSGGEDARFSEIFEPAGAETQVRLSISQIDAGRWHLRVRRADDRSTQLHEERLPEWVVEEHYDFQLASESISKRHTAVILAAVPGVHADAPPSAAQFQIVWLLDHGGRTLDWKRIDTAQHSTLDGGERFELRQRAGSWRLIRLRREKESILCGASSDEPVIFDQFDPVAGRFEQTLDLDRMVDDATPLESELAAQDFQPPKLQAWFQWFAASSDQRSPDRRGALIRPLELGDAKVDTGWMEGAEGLGRGEFVSSQLNDATELASFRIVPGSGGGEAAFEAYARPTRLLVALSDGSRYVVDLDELDYEDVASGRGLLVELPEPRKTRCMSVMLLEARRGKSVRGQPSWAPQTTFVAEITPYASLHAGDARATAGRIVARIASEEDARSRQRLAEMALPLEEELAAEVHRALESGTAEQRRRTIPLLANLSAEEAVPVLLEFLRETEPGAPEYRPIKRSLAAHYADSADGLVAYLKQAPADTSGRKYTDVVRLLGRVGQPEHLEQLIEQFGNGNQKVRNERVRAVSAGGEPLVEPLLEHARWHVNTDAGYDALRALNLIGKRLYYQNQGELPRSELYAALLEQSADRRSLMRALRVAMYFEVEDFVSLVRAEFVDYGDALVRRAALEAVGRYEGAPARQVLVDALEDSSPDVRIGAINALATRDDARQALPELLDYARRERWKSGLQQAFRVLASIDDERTDRAFEALLRERPNDEAALLAASALDRAGRPIDAKLAKQLVSDRDTNLQMRREVLDLLGLDDSEFGERFLLELFDDEGWKQLSEATHEQEKLREHVVLSLGRRRSQTAMPKLVNLAKHGESTQTQRTALRALAFYEDEALLADLSAWREDADPRLRGVLDQTIGMIERRQDVESIKHEIDEILEEDESETRDDPDASQDQPKGRH